MLDDYLPRRVNTGPWVTAYTLNELYRRHDADFLLPICSLTTPFAQCIVGDALVLPPLYHEALVGQLRGELVDRITECFPRFGSVNSDRIRVVELPRVESALDPCNVLAFSIDTAVEEHGPHLPLATDTIQSYSVLRQLDREYSELQLGRPLEYGQLTWGLPFGFSIDLTAELLKRYVTAFVNALMRLHRPSAIYVVDVHGSITHRKAIVAGLRDSECPLWTFRWLHEPLAELASQRGDQHAGGVETALVERVSGELLDERWWPDRIDDLAADQMSFTHAVELTPDLTAFTQYVREHSLNGIIGDIHNYKTLDAGAMFDLMMQVARQDVQSLLEGKASNSAGGNLW